jgi:hypothetical protein
LKSKLVAARLLLLLVPFLLPGCASAPAPPLPSGLLVPESFYVPAADEPLFGTWVNPKLTNKSWYPKVIIHPWGLYEVFGSPSDEAYDWRGTATIVEKWTDAQGNTWYKQFVRCSLKNFYSGHCFELDRISPDGGTLECIFGNLAWPDVSEMDPAANSTYAKYRRQ